MSFINPDIGREAKNGVSALSQEHDGLNSGMQNMSINKAKKKRPARAFHTEFNSPGIIKPSSSIPPSPNQFNGQPSAMSSPLFSNQIPAQVDQNQEAPKDDNQIVENDDLTLPEYRYHEQAKFTTPVSDSESKHRSFFTFEHASPPTSGTQFHSVDQGTASSKFIRSTMYFVPETEQLRQATKLPVSVTIRPFAPLLKTEDPVPVVDMQQLGHSDDADPLDIGPPRCRRCRTYINPSMQYTSNTKFTCNICQFSNNTVSSDYACFLDSQGYRLDKFSRPELHKGVYDLIVPKEYNFGGPKSENLPLHYIFLIDISEHSIKQNLPALISDSIRAVLYSNEREDESDLFDPDDPPRKKLHGKVAIMTFDKRIQFYNLSSSLDSTQISISSDLDDPFVPFSEGLFVDPEESGLVIEDALNHLESLSSQEGMITEAEPCYAAACRTAMMCLEKVGGGKIISVLSSLPSWGPGSLKYKDNKAVGRSLAPEIEKTLFLPDNDYYKLLAKDFISKNVGLDCLVVSPTAVDLSNIGWLCSVTGGSVRKWTNFNFERDSRGFMGHFVNSVKKSRGYQGQLKVRCSNGLQVAQYYGTSSSITDTSVVGNVQDPIIPVVNEDQTFTVLFSYDGKLNTKYDCHFQAALLYTDPNGIRKVRVINLVLAVAERLEDVFNLIDEDSIVTTIVRDTLSFIGKQTLIELRESVNEKLVEVFTQYRAMSELGHNQYNILTKQLLFPEKLKHLPMYMLAFIKSKAIRSSSTISADARLADIYQMFNMPIERLLYHLYPVLVELHTLNDDEGLFEDVHNFIKLPIYKELTINKLEYGVYILCDGDKVLVWVHPNANILLIKDLFGEDVESIDQISPYVDELPVLMTNISQQARNIIKFFQSEVVGLSSIDDAGIQIIRQGIDGSESLFKEALVEDSLQGTIAASSGPSYPEYLTNLHKSIRVRLENDKSSNSVRQSINSVEHHNDTLAQRMINF